MGKECRQSNEVVTKDDPGKQQSMDERRSRGGNRVELWNGVRRAKPGCLGKRRLFVSEEQRHSNWGAPIKKKKRESYTKMFKGKSDGGLWRYDKKILPTRDMNERKTV